MKRFVITAPIAAALLAVFGQSQAVAQERSLADLLSPGQQVTLSATDPSTGAATAYIVQVYHPALKAATVETNEILSHASLRDPNNGSPARSRAMMEAAARRGGGIDARDLAAVRELTTRSRGGFGGSRLAPERVVFYEVSEIGKDFVAFKQGKTTRFVALANIREISMQAIDDEEAKQQADAQVANAHVMVFSRMLAAFAADMGKLPTQSQGLQALVRAPMDLEDASPWRGPYFGKAAIPDDPWGQPYTWTAKDEGAQVEVRASGPDKTANTADDIVAIAPVLYVSSEGAVFGAAGGGFGGGGFGAPAPAVVPALPLVPAAPRAAEPSPARPPMEPMPR